MRCLTSLALLFGLGSSGVVFAQHVEEGYEPLVEGTDPNQLELVEIDEETISISEDGVISLTGTPNGYFATKESYDDYILRFDWRYERPSDLSDDSTFDGNSGVLLHIQGEPKVWPKCVEAQLKYTDAGHLFGIGGGAFESRHTDQARQQARVTALKPVGEWNSEVILCESKRIVCTINGEVIDAGFGAEPSSGQIGWQSEGRPIQFRNLRIRVLD